MDMRRIHWIDIARGFFIIAIVLGHVFNTGYIRNWLFSFHVPAFFFLSGFCFKYEKNAGKYIAKKVKTIVIPYIVFSIISIAIFYVASLLIPNIQSIVDCDITDNVRVMLYGNSKPDVMKYNSPLWFLPCLFCVTLLAYGVERLTYKCALMVRYVAMLLSIVVCVILNSNESLAFPWHLETALSMLVWYLLGISIRTTGLVQDKKRDELTKNGIIPILLILMGGGYQLPKYSYCRNTK